VNKFRLKKVIGINTLFLIPGKVGGTEIFLRNLVKELAELDKYNEYLIFVNNENQKLFENLPQNFNVVHCNFNASNRLVRIIWEQLILPIQLLFYQVDVLHSPGYTAPIFTYCKKITTIFDLNYHFHPEDFTFSQNLVYKILIPLVAKFTDVIIVHSENSKKELSRVLNINSKKIVVIYPGVSEYFYKKHTKKELDDFLKKYNINFPYILSSAVSHPHKNLTSLLKAYAFLVKKNEIKQKLVLLGFKGRDSQNLDKIIDENNLNKEIIFTGWVANDKSSYIFQGADLFVFPSLYEGFGLPSIEAMASKIPLVASNYSCIPEVVGDAGLLVDAKDYKKLAGAITKVLNAKRLRNKLITKGNKRIKIFSWRKLAIETHDLYMNV